jgi:acetyl-CoA carboxylase biotin carboxylase subunit
MFNKVLIANRGEIAVRIIRACIELGIQTVAVYSEADSEALHVQLADEAVCIGPGKVADSYLNMQNIISATVLTGAEAIHPGFGFLSENARFAEMCEACQIQFIGPTGEMIDQMGNKSKAREIMMANDVPVVPGSDGAVADENEALRLAEEIGYPVMIKASAGGGGRGMRIAHGEDDFLKAFNAARGEARVAFGDDTVYLEKFVENPRHIEIQILADHHGNVIHLGERDCSAQRRHQKVLEESPSSLIDDDTRKAMGDAAVKAAKAVSYRNAGTIEFLVDKYLNFYFIEMNTRIQVEHPVTEMVTGIDLIQQQLKIASGEALDIKQDDIEQRGHAIECRINAEDPTLDFRPCPGLIEGLHLPGGLGVRIDSAIYQGYKVPALYDSMLAKLIVHADTREEARARMLRALDEFIVQGIETNIEFQKELLTDHRFVSGNFDTSLIASMQKG